MRTCSRSLLLGAILAQAAGAQQSASAECTASAVAQMTAAQLFPAWAPYAPDSLEVRFKPARERNAWTEVADTIAMLFGLTQRPNGFASPPSRISGAAVIRAHFDTLRRQLDSGERISALQLNGNVDAKRFQPLVGALGPPSLFTGYGSVVGLDDLSPAETRSICWLALSLTDLATMYGERARVRLAEAYHARAVRWDNYARHGYSMMPLELFLNGYMPHAPGEPPALNLVVAHASAGEQFYNREPLSWRSLARNNVLVLEPIGLIRYVNNASWYWGATWALAYPDSGGIATGPMVHLKNIGHAAYLIRPKDPAGRRNSVLVSLDLYRYVAGVSGKLLEHVTKARQDSATAVQPVPIRP